MPVSRLHRIHFPRVVECVANESIGTIAMTTVRQHTDEDDDGEGQTDKAGGGHHRGPIKLDARSKLILSLHRSVEQ